MVQQHDEHIQTLAREGAAPLGEAIDDIIQTHIERARAIVALSDALDGYDPKLFDPEREQ